MTDTYDVKDDVLWHRETNYYDTPEFKNELCPIARKIVKHSGKCTESCPFASCVIDLPGGTRKMLQDTKKIIRALDLLTCGKSKAEVSHETNIHYRRIEYYSNNKDYLYEILLGYGIVKDLGI